MKLVGLVLVLVVAGCDQGEVKPKAAPVVEVAKHNWDADIANINLDQQVLDLKIDLAVEKVASAESDATRSEAKAALEVLWKQKAALADRLAATEAAAAQSRRVTISQACIDNPLAKDCM